LRLSNQQELKSVQRKKTDGNSNSQTKVTSWVLVKVAARALLLEAAWNNTGQQNLGFLASMDPALQAIYADSPHQLQLARLRALHFFNTNPIASGLVIGATIKLEEELVRGNFTEKHLNTMRNALSSALASQGDRLFWQSWLPLCCLSTILLANWSNLLYAPLLLVVLIAVFALSIRFGGLFIGYRLGHQVHTVINRFHVNSIIIKLQLLVVVLLSMLTAAFLWAAHHSLQTQFWRVLTVSLIFFVVARLYQRLCRYGQRWQIYLFYPLILIAFGCSTLIL
jgi:mannose/fructose/N-acetylgalactosamine-specific phosphotransferase system component IID